MFLGIFHVEVMYFFFDIIYKSIKKASRIPQKRLVYDQLHSCLKLRVGFVVLIHVLVCFNVLVINYRMKISSLKLCNFVGWRDGVPGPPVGKGAPTRRTIKSHLNANVIIIYYKSMNIIWGLLSCTVLMVLWLGMNYAAKSFAAWPVKFTTEALKYSIKV